MANGNDNQVDSLKLGIEIGGLDNSQIKNLKDLNNTLGNLDKILTSDFVKRLEVLSNIKINVDTNQLDKLNKEFKNITNNAENAKEVLEKGKSSMDLSKEVSDISEYRKQLKEAEKSVKQYHEAGLSFKGQPEYEKYYKEQEENAQKEVERLRNIINEKKQNKAQSVQDTSTKETVSNITEITNKEQLYIAKLDLVKSKLKDTKLSEEQRVRLSGQRLSLEEKLSKLKNKEIKDDEKTTKEQKKSSGFLGKFGKTLGRIALYRAIRAILKTITQTIRQGAQAFAQFSPQFNETMTQLTSAGKNLAMSFTSAFAPIIEAVTPFIVNLANSLTTINNKIAEAIAYMREQDYYYGVNIENQEEYNKAVNKLSFDKFDVLQQNGYNGFTKMAVDTEKMAKYSGVFNNIKSLIETFKKGLSAVKEPLSTLWNIIKAFVMDYGDAITSFLRTTMEGSIEMWKILGDLLKVIQSLLSSDFVKSQLYISLGILTGTLETIKGLIVFVYEVLKSIITLDFSSFGENIKSAFNFTSVGSTFKKSGDSIKGFFSKLGNGLKDFFKWIGSSGTWSSFNAYASGGVPDMGTFFLAGEAGAEVVGTMSGGRTGVMNMEQMENAVKKGMIEAYSLFANRRTESSETINVNISDETLFTAVRKTAKRRGFDFANV